jgi:hypothetical protein
VQWAGPAVVGSLVEGWPAVGGLVAAAVWAVVAKIVQPPDLTQLGRNQRNVGSHRHGSDLVAWPLSCCLVARCEGLEPPTVAIFDNELHTLPKLGRYPKENTSSSPGRAGRQ